MPKVGLVSPHGDGVWFAALFAQEGCEVTYCLADPRYSRYLEGIAPPPVRTLSSAGDFDLVVFDLSGMGERADEAKKESPTIGGSSLADRLEHDRLFGIEYMQKCGISVPNFEVFDDPSDGIRYLKKTKKRVVFKPSGEQDCSTTYVARDHEDMIRFMDVLFRKTHVKQYILQDFIPGTEISTEMWINGKGYYLPNHTFETKKFMNDDKGPATGCSGNVLWIPRKETAVFRKGLKLAADRLISDGYVGNIDLNAIVTEGQVLGLEWTPRFGYEGTANLTRLLPMDFGEFLFRVATGEDLSHMDATYGCCAAVRLSIPPYPLESAPRKMYQEGVPIEGIELPKDLESFFLCDVRMVPDTEKLESAGDSGFIGCPLETAETFREAFAKVKQRIEGLNIPNLQYRTDSRDVFTARYDTLERQGWMREA